MIRRDPTPHGDRPPDPSRSPPYKLWVLAQHYTMAGRFDVPLPEAGTCLLDQGDLIGREVNGVLAVPFFPFEQTVVPGAPPLVRDGLLHGDVVVPDPVSRHQLRDPVAPPSRMNPAQPVGSDRQLRAVGSEDASGMRPTGPRTPGKPYV
ncbi:hypothetical protein DSECCO2_295010 [anaerobic digester metagenome]